MDENTTYHFVGIKGTGMSALALLLKDMGAKVQGSDIEKHTFTQDGLIANGIDPMPFSKDNIHEGLTVIAGNAFPDTQEEIAAAKAQGIPVIRYHEFLGELMKDFTSIGVAGTHGKTSTTGLLAHVLSGVAKTNFLVGDGTGKGSKDARFFVFEADEYRRHFIAYHPDYMIMTNIDFDHPDYYHDLDDVISAFQQEANQVKKAILAWGDDPNLRQLTSDAPIYYYGTNDTDDFQATNISRTTTGSEFDVLHHGENIGHYQIELFGEHNVLNSLAVIAIGYLEKIPYAELAPELKSFRGVKRRFSRSDVKDMVIIDDYAHHPNEIKATLDAAHQEFPDKKIIAVFQPHTYSRLKALMNGFAESLDLADDVYITEVFGSARESSGDVDSQDLEDKIDRPGQVLKGKDLTPLLQYHDAVVVFMGAGDIEEYETVYKDLLNKENR